MKISGLYVYPVKGAAGIALEHARLDAFGIEHDRRWMIVDAAGEFITQREHHELALLSTALEADALVITSPGGSVRLPLTPSAGDTREVRVWDDSVRALDAGDDAASMLSAHVGEPVRLVYMPDDELRQVDTTYARVGDRVSFADGFPLLLISQASVDELGRRAGREFGMRRFRPNVVVTGTVPHAEDAWRRIAINDVELDVVKPCARCVVPTIDPDTATAGVEPSRTLATYRRVSSKIYFGQNVIHRTHGTLNVGDAVRVLHMATPRPEL